MDLIKIAHGDDPLGWPAAWRFGRVVRNAIAHGGEIEIRNPTAAPVTWRSATYGPAHHGKPLLYRDFTVVEAVLLMADMDEAVCLKERPEAPGFCQYYAVAALDVRRAPSRRT